MMALGWTAVGRPRSVIMLAIGLLVFTIFPPFTLMMAGYDLAILALLMVSVILIVLHSKFEKGTGLFRTKIAGSALSAVRVPPGLDFGK
jgi:hypothetical protein